MRLSYSKSSSLLKHETVNTRWPNEKHFIEHSFKIDYHSKPKNAYRKHLALTLAWHWFDFIYKKNFYSFTLCQLHESSAINLLWLIISWWNFTLPITLPKTNLRLTSSLYAYLLVRRVFYNVGQLNSVLQNITFIYSSQLELDNLTHVLENPQFYVVKCYRKTNIYLCEYARLSCAET